MEPDTEHCVVVRTCLNAAYSYAYRRCAMAVLRENANTIQQPPTNALTGAVAHRRRRRPCRFPEHRQHAIPQQDWEPIDPTATPRAMPAAEAFGYDDIRLNAAPASSGDNGHHAANNTTASGASLPWPVDDFLDIFGHGGALD